MKYLRSSNVLLPAQAIDLINYPFYDGIAKASTTDDHLTVLSGCGDTPTGISSYPVYQTGYIGDLYVTPAERMALSDYESYASDYKQLISFFYP